MAIDDFDDGPFTKPGAIPFKWEVRPGVPKIQVQQKKQPPPPPPPSQQQPHKHHRINLKPPPSGSVLFLSPPESETRTKSFRSGSASRARSDRWRFEQPSSIQTRRPETVSSSGCFISPLLRRKMSNIGSGARTVPVVVPESEPDFSSDLETLTRWSMSSRKSLLSPFRHSPTSTSSYSSYQSSPQARPVCDAEWAGFGLF